MIIYNCTEEKDELRPQGMPFIPNPIDTSIKSIATISKLGKTTENFFLRAPCDEPLVMSPSIGKD